MIRPKIFQVILLLLHLSNCEKINCNWQSEYLCGDKCLKTNADCICGNETFAYWDTYYFNCCNNDGPTCFKHYNGDVSCRNGAKVSWREKCGGTCIETSDEGIPTLPCDDQIECYSTTYACNGAPLCKE